MSVPNTFKRVSDLDELSIPDVDDYLFIVDRSDLSETPTGKSKKIRAGNLMGNQVGDNTPAGGPYKLWYTPTGTEGSILIMDGSNGLDDLRGRYIITLLLNYHEMEEIIDVNLLDPDKYLFDDASATFTFSNDLQTTDKIKFIYR